MSDARDPARFTPVYRPELHPDAANERVRRDLDQLFGHLFPGKTDPQIDDSHAGLAIAAHNPTLALHLAKLSSFMALDMEWSQRRDLRELAVLTVNRHFGCDYGFRTRTAAAEAAGISRKQQAALTTGSIDPFDEEQRLVIDYSRAVASGNVDDQLSQRAIEKFGEKGAVEMTALIAFWSFWAMFLNATRPD